MVPSHLLVALARRGLLGEAHAAQERVLAELALHCEYGSLQVVFALIGRHVGEEVYRCELLGNEVAEPHAHAPDGNVFAHALTPQFIEGGHELAV